MEGDRRVLIVDDDGSVADVTAEMLARVGTDRDDRDDGSDCRID